jgi:hypothetical protein
MSLSMDILRETNITPLIWIADKTLPRLMESYRESLNDQQRAALDQVMPVGGEKQVYFRVTDSPTPPILVTLANPPKLSTISLDAAKAQRIPGLSLTTGDLQLLADGLSLGSVWSVLKGQVFSVPPLMRLFMPLIRLGSAQLQDMWIKLKSQLKF